jgi:hypothetical protein
MMCKYLVAKLLEDGKIGYYLRGAEAVTHKYQYIGGSHTRKK